MNRGDCVHCGMPIVRTHARTKRGGWAHEHTGLPGCHDGTGAARRAKPAPDNYFIETEDAE